MAAFFPRNALALAGTAALLFARPAESREAREPHALVREIAQSAASIRLDLRAARSNGEQRRARCLSEKLSEVHAQQRMAEHHAADLARTHDAQSARRYRYLLESAADHSHDLTVEARQCGARRATSLRVIPPRVTVQ
jgi:hypothetical protein